MRNWNWKKKLEDVRATLDLTFSHDTANPGTQSDIPSAGHCAIVSMLIRECFGGEMVSTPVDGQSHWYNKIYLGGQNWMYIWVDLTGDQFGFKNVQYRFDAPIYPETRDRVWEDLNDNTKKRYAVFKERYEQNFKINEENMDMDAVLSDILQEEIWNEITAETGETRLDRDYAIVQDIISVASKIPEKN